MGKWLDLAAKLEAGGGGEAKRDNRDESPPFVSNVPNVLGHLPADVRAGLARLQSAPAPNIADPEVWPEIVADALRLATEGWAGQALLLDWAASDLWGHSEDAPGLAVWLTGRRVLGLTERVCTVEAKPGALAFYNRRSSERVFLWDLGR